MFGADEIEVVGRGVVLRVAAVGGTREAAHGQVEAGRAELAFVVAVGEERDLFVRLAAFGQHQRHDPVDVGIAPAAALVVVLAAIAHTRDHHPMGHTPRHVLPLRQPADGADGGRNEDEAVGVATTGQCSQRLRQPGGGGNARQVVVGQRGVADVGGDEHLLGAVTGQDAFAEGHRPLHEIGIDTDLVGAGLQRLQLPVGQAEAPVTLEVLRAIGNPVRPVGQREEMRAQFVQRQRPPKRGAVVDQMQVVVGNVHHLAAVRPLDPRGPHHPFLRHLPVEDLRAGGDFGDRERNVMSNGGQRVAHALPGDAAQHRVELGAEGVHGGALPRGLAGKRGRGQQGRGGFGT